RLAARPLQAALASAGTFAVGAALPILSVVIVPRSAAVAVVSAVSLVCLIAMGALAARVGGAPAWKGALRVGIWGAAAMGATSLVGKFFGTVGV
ncbi:MAG TPA: VIT1/CCC1 transporter family protein, partial [Candidatus Polarisedimenticolaceae bacterium]|nr:VIT1/CCC1 transporter family protein [Candidatus Polarisedimenticolaceae bacterium]